MLIKMVVSCCWCITVFIGYGVFGIYASDFVLIWGKRAPASERLLV